MAMENTYQCLKILKEARELLKCPVCLEIITETVELSCRHRICKSCHSSITTQYTDLKCCPLCKKPILRRARIYKDLYADEFGKSCQDLLAQINQMYNVKVDFLGGLEDFKHNIEKSANCNKLITTEKRTNTNKNKTSQLHTHDNKNFNRGSNKLVQCSAAANLRKSSKHNVDPLKIRKLASKDKQIRVHLERNKSVASTSKAPSNCKIVPENTNHTVMKKNKPENHVTSYTSNTIAKDINEFDSLLSNHHATKPRVYTNRNKAPNREERFVKLLKFEDNENKIKVLEWLNDNSNLFGRLTQTQVQDSEANTSQPFNLPSVSQQKLPRILNKTSKDNVCNVVKTANNNVTKHRAKSLEVADQKQTPYNLKLRRHSFAGDTPEVDNYHIEESNTEEEKLLNKVEEIALIDIIEDEYLNKIDKDLLDKGVADKPQNNTSKAIKTHSKMKEGLTVTNTTKRVAKANKAIDDSGWERMKHIRRTIRKKEKVPKKLNITLQTTQNTSKNETQRSESTNCKKSVDKSQLGEDTSKQIKTFDLDKLEKYISENIQKVQTVDTESTFHEKINDLGSTINESTNTNLTLQNISKDNSIQSKTSDDIIQNPLNFNIDENVVVKKERLSYNSNENTRTEDNLYHQSTQNNIHFNENSNRDDGPTINKDYDVFDQPTQKIVIKTLNNSVAPAQNADIPLNFKLKFDQGLNILDSMEGVLKSIEFENDENSTDVEMLSLPSKLGTLAKPVTKFLNQVSFLSKLHPFIDQLREFFHDLQVTESKTFSCKTQTNNAVIQTNKPETHSLSDSSVKLNITTKTATSNYLSCSNVSVQRANVNRSTKQVQTDHETPEGFLISANDFCKTQELSEAGIQTDEFSCPECNYVFKKSSVFLCNSNKAVPTSQKEHASGKYTLTEFFDDINFETQDILKQAEEKRNATVKSQERTTQDSNTYQQQNFIQEKGESEEANAAKDVVVVDEPSNKIHENAETNVAEENVNSQSSSVLEISVPSSKLTKKRRRVEVLNSDSDGEDNPVKKRPHNKFLPEELSVVFCSEESVQAEEQLHQSNDSDDTFNYEEYICQALDKYDNDGVRRSSGQSTSKAVTVGSNVSKSNNDTKSKVLNKPIYNELVNNSHNIDTNSKGKENISPNRPCATPEKTCDLIRKNKSIEASNELTDEHIIVKNHDVPPVLPLDDSIVDHVVIGKRKVPESLHTSNESPDNHITKKIHFGPSTSKEIHFGPSTSKEIHSGPSTSKEIHFGPSTSKEIQFEPSASKEIHFGPSTSKEIHSGPSTSKKIHSGLTPSKTVHQSPQLTYSENKFSDEMADNIFLDAHNMSQIERDINAFEKVAQNVNSEDTDIIAATAHNIDYFKIDKQISNRAHENLKQSCGNSLSENLFTNSLSCTDNVKVQEQDSPEFQRKTSLKSKTNKENHDEDVNGDLLNKMDMDVFEESDSDQDTEVIANTEDGPGIKTESVKHNKVNVLQNITLANEDTVAAQNNLEDDMSDSDIVDTTPQKERHPIDIRSNISQRSLILEYPLPPPPGFGDDDGNEDSNMLPEDVDNLKYPNITLDDNVGDALNCSSVLGNSKEEKEGTQNFRETKYKMLGTSTPFSGKLDSENVLSLSPIPARRSNLNVIELVKQSKFTPLAIGVRPSPPSQKSIVASTPKQKSILSYVVKPNDRDKKSEIANTKPCIACTRLSKEQVISISSLTNKKLATYSNSFTDSVTHMIVSVTDKNCVKDHTMKYVLAIASGVWVVNYQWVQECLAANSIIPEEPFEVLDVSGVPGPKTSRLTRRTNPLLVGFKFHAAPPFQSTTQLDVEKVVSLLGGKVVARPEDLLEDDGLKGIIITEASATQDFEMYEVWLETLKVVTVDIEWLSKSVGQYSLVSLRSFALCSDDSICDLGYPEELLGEPLSYPQTAS